MKFLQGMHFVVGGTEAEAHRKADELEDSLDIEALLAHVGGGFGVDLGGLPLDTPLGDLETEGSQGHLTAIRASVRGGNPTLRDIALYRSRANRVVGTPEQIADRLEQWQDAGIDGINIINQTIPGSYTDFIDGVLPELRQPRPRPDRLRAGNPAREALRRRAAAQRPPPRRGLPGSLHRILRGGRKPARQRYRPS